MTAGKLIPVKMRSSDVARPDVLAFHCGSAPHETPLADWIKSHAADQIKGGCKVWLYRIGMADGPLVGYGSYSTGKIKTTEGLSEREIKVYEVRMLALHRDFWGHPKGVKDPEEKFSRQIVRHLQKEVAEAQTRGSRERILTLYVHPDAERAQELYFGCGFQFAPGRFLPDPDIPPERAAGLLGMDYVW
jgi:hypothetical protein